MNPRNQALRRWGFGLTEVLVTLGVVASLQMLGYSAYRAARRDARVCVAESRLKQISLAMELYFQKHRCYPPRRSDLTVALAPYIASPGVFSNPLARERRPGQTINSLYKQPTLAEVDSPDNYVTAMVDETGQTAVVLLTGHRVERLSNLPASRNP